MANRELKEMRKQMLSQMEQKLHDSWSSGTEGRSSCLGVPLMKYDNKMDIRQGGSPDRIAGAVASIADSGYSS